MVIICVLVSCWGYIPLSHPSPLVYDTLVSTFHNQHFCHYTYMYRPPIILCLIVFVLLLLSVHVASYTQALKGCMFMRLQAGIFTLRTCARGKVIGLSICRCHCHCCRCRHENLKISRCRNLSELQVRSSCQMQQKNWLEFASNRRHGPGSPQILRFVLTTPINHTYGWPWLWFLLMCTTTTQVSR